MYKRIFALIVIFAMLVPFSPAVAADDSSAKPTVEEILNEYHQTAFAAKNADRSGAVSAASRNSASKTLEQETVDNLNAAGYEAYNVTPSNYNALEKSLQTDFGDLGLDPSGSYIVVITAKIPKRITVTQKLGGLLISVMKKILKAHHHLPTPTTA